MTRISLLIAFLLTYLFVLPLSGQTLLEDAKELNQIITNDQYHKESLTFEIIENIPKEIDLRSTDVGSFPPFELTLKPQDTLAVTLGKYCVTWLMTEDSMQLVANPNQLILPKSTFAILDSPKTDAKKIKLYLNKLGNPIFLSYHNPQLGGYFKNNSSEFSDAMSHLLYLNEPVPNAERILKVEVRSSLVKEKRDVSYKDLVIYKTNTPKEIEMVKYQTNLPQPIADFRYEVRYTKEVPQRYIRFRKGSTILDILPVPTSGLDFEFLESERAIAFTKFETIQPKWHRYELEQDTFFPALDRLDFHSFYNLNIYGYGKFYAEKPSQYYTSSSRNFLQKPLLNPEGVWDESLQVRATVPKVDTSITPLFLPNDVPHSLILTANKAGEIALNLGTAYLEDIPILSANGSAEVEVLKKGRELFVRHPVRLPSPTLHIPITTGQKLKVVSLLGRHSMLQSNELGQSNLHSTISDTYRSNEYLNQALSPYFSKGFKLQFNADFDKKLQANISQNLSSQDWQQALANEKNIEINTQTAYREVTSAYRTPVNTAADNLQLASQQFENGSKQLRKGLSATTIAAGLSDFIVERAQEELNLTFLDRLRNGMLNDTSEFKILFPRTRDMLLDFEVDKYQTLLTFAKKAFVQDLQNLGINFPQLFELQKYDRLKNDPNVFNIFLLYDIANQVYEDAPIEEVLLKINQRLYERRQSLNQSINLALADSLRQQPVLQKKLMNDVGEYMDQVRYMDEAIDQIRAALNQMMRQTSYGLMASPDLLRKLNTDVPTRTLMETQLLSNQNEDNRQRADERILLTGSENDPNVQLQQYETLTPLHLEGDPAYWYTLKKLPFAETSLFFDESLPPTTVIATGINQVRQLLGSNPENIYGTWLNRLEEGIVFAKNRREELEARNKSRQIKALKDLQARRATIQLGLWHEVRFWEQLLQTGYTTKDGRPQVGYSVRHDHESIRYLYDVFKNPQLYDLYDWEKLDAVNDYLLKAAAIPTDPIDAEIFHQNSPYPLEVVVRETNQFLDDFVTQVENRVQKLQQKFSPESTAILNHYANTERLFIFFMGQSDLGRSTKVLDFTTFLANMEQQMGALPAILSPVRDMVITEIPVNAFLARCEQLPRELVNETYAVPRDLQFNNLEEDIGRARLRFARLADRKALLAARFDSLESRCITKLFAARQHADQLNQLVQLSTYLLYALKAEESEATINVVDSVFQQVRRTKTDASGEMIEITYDSLILKTRTIANGANTRKWLQPSQLVAINENPDLHRTFYGLLSERLKALNPDFNYSEKNLQLVMNKAVFAINEIDEQRALLRHKKSTSQPLSFSDYYPFIRATVDLLNEVIQSPIYQEASLIERFPKLKNLPNISDQSLSLFENIFAEQYPDALQNVIGLLAIIWDVDLEVALAEEQARMAHLTATSTNAKKNIKKITRKKGKASKKLKSKLLVYGSFMANVTTAQNANQVKAAIRAVAVPPGSSSVKRKTDLNVAFNAYFGLGVHGERLTNALIPNNQKWGTTVGLSVPVGVSASLGAFGKNRNCGLSLFVPILDVGGVTAFRISDDGSTGDLPELTFGNLISPGGYLMINLPKSPFSIGFGGQYGPQVRKITVGETELNSSAWKIGVTASIDVPIFNLFSR
ncbi:MAG: hypothetical protein AAGJ18_06355 [Bacteroidota bacterium]